jgi:RNA polymerase sigma-70 factor (ECF subfamily)
MKPHERVAALAPLDHLALAETGLERDDELAVAARVDSRAFEALYLRHRTPVYRYLATRTIDSDDAADLTALTFERAFVAIGTYRTGGVGIRAWLLRIARNAAIDHGRRRRAAPILEPLVAPIDGPEAKLEADEAALELRHRVAALPPDQRDAIVLRFAGGLSAREIGIVLAKSEAASQKLVSRGLQALKEVYGVNPTER